MITKEIFEKIFEKALPYASAYQAKFESSLDSVENKDIVVAYVGLLVGMIQEVYIKSVPGESLDDIQQMKEIVDLVFEKARSKVSVWDAKRKTEAVASSSPSVDEIMSKLGMNVKRSPDDRIN